MKYEQIKMQFEELCDIIIKLLGKKEKDSLKIKQNNAKFIKFFSEVVNDYDTFLKLLEISDMSARELFIVILSYTGCDLKQLTKPMTRDLRKSLKSRKIL